MGSDAYLGIDLGTTNTVAALFDGEHIELVRASDGGTLTPSVVRIDARGKVTVGSRARKLADRDPENTHGAFKRLMGTDRPIRFPAAGASRRPEELSAEILGAIRHDVREQAGFLPEQAVITVPALFELPQSSATSAAARLAGFSRVELIQEPVASALAAGWSAEDDAGGAWLVYDLGGGTFDVSLLETREGLLRVVGHDGDNFLGGRDIDQAIVQWALARLAAAGRAIDRADPAHAAALRALRAAAEEAKIELSRAAQADIAIPELFEAGDGPLDVELTLDRAALEILAAPIVERSLAVCRRLLEAHGRRPADLQRVVLVGGPTVMPLLRQRVADGLGAPFAEGIDPMALVARGAAIYAATAGLSARPPHSEPPDARWRLWLEYPTLSPDPTPFVVGRLLDPHGERARDPQHAPAEVRFARDDGGAATDWVPVGADGTLMTMVELAPRRPNTFAIEARDRAGQAVPILPASMTIVCGLTLSDPPLSRSVGIALADDRTRVYLERGAPLPARRTYVHQTVEAVSAGTDEIVLQIPIVQGEAREAHLCRLVGWFRITGRELCGALPAGSDVEVTLEVDRGGRLTARALIPSLSQAFEQIAYLSIPDADPAELAVQLSALSERLGLVRRWTGADPKWIDRLIDVEWALQDADASIVTARGGDPDAAQRARRLLLDADQTLCAAEEAARWPELEQRARSSLATASSWVSQLGTTYEQQMLTEAATALDRARRERRADEMEGHLGTIVQLAHTAYYRHPEAWRWQFEHATSDIGRCKDPARARALADEGRSAIARGDAERLRSVVVELFALLPASVRAPIPGYRSGLR